MDHLGTATVGVGVATGLASGALNAVAFLMSRHHATARPGGGQRMLVLAHLVMGIACLPIAWLLMPAQMPPAASSPSNPAPSPRSGHDSVGSGT